MNKYNLTVGIEVHAELTTKSKMFCGCKNDPHVAEANQNTCPVCLAHPGTLPSVNKEAVRKLLMVARAVKGEIAEYTEFDRKNYFYPDIPKAYQLSQYQFPFVKGGELAGVKITRIHLEEDTARSLHDQGSDSIVDFNRAGVPLMELVTEPVIHDAKAAGNFTRELQLLLKTLGVSDANMERGEMRVEANISVSQTEEMADKYVEVKNINSHKAMELAIKFEMKRQIELIESGQVIVQETRGWDENKSRTFSQRTKEGAADYRYFPDPDIPKMDTSLVAEFQISRLDEVMPELPDDKRVFYRNLGIPSDQIEMIVSDIPLDAFFRKVATQELFSKPLAGAVANYLTSDVVNIMTADPTLDIAEANPEGLIKLMIMTDKKLINSRVTKDLLPEVLFKGIDPNIEAEKRGLLQQNSTDDLLPIVKKIITENQAVADEYKAGKEAAIKYLIGQAMKETKGAANPTLLQSLFEQEI